VDLICKGEMMKMTVGLWIDHRKAIIVTVTDKGEETGLIISKAEKQLRRSGDSPLKGSYESSQVPASDSRQRTLTGHLNIYYDAVIASIRDAEAILIFGPGDAKDELKRRLKRNKLAGRIAGLETVDKMTDRQIAAKVRKYLQKVDYKCPGCHATLKLVPPKCPACGKTLYRGPKPPAIKMVKGKSK
jgi:hypothetical protein